uniref:Uncharacterized protein n=1 Tax=Populus trichocarpa TaxID=3694 RepID=A0A2K2AYC7_POPTR
MDRKMEAKNVAGREMCCCCELCSSVALGLENNMQGYWILDYCCFSRLRETLAACSRSRPQCWRKGEEVLGAPVCCGELAGHSCRPEEEQMEHWRLTVQLSKTKLTTGCCWTMEEMVVRVVDAAVDYNEGLE